MNRRTLATWAGAAGIALAVMAGPRPAGATTTPPTTNVVRSETISNSGATPINCPDCDAKNASGGNGDGFVFSFVQLSPGVCAHEVLAVNKGTDGVDATVLPWPTVVLGPKGIGADKHVFLVPAHQPGPDTLYVRMTSTDGKVIIGGDGPGGTKPVVLSCPCPPAPTTTTAVTPSTSPTSSAPPSSSTPGSSAPSTTVPGGSAPTSSPGTNHLSGSTLPPTGASSGDVAFAGVGLLGLAGFLLIVGRKRGVA